MFRNTRFNELMQPINRRGFRELVKQHGSDKHSKGFGSWDQLVAMVYGQITGARSLRELETGFNSQASRHYHLGCRAVRRSTLADANAKRDSAVFEALVGQLMSRVKRQQKRRLQSGMFLLDSTSITLKGLGYDDWTLSHQTRNCQGIKAHVLYSPHSESPLYLNVTAPNVNDVTDAQNVPLESGATYVFDKGYCSYSWWHEIDRRGAYFVTRAKYNAALKVTDSRPVPAQAEAVLHDETVILSNRYPGGGRVNPYRNPLRRITIARPEKATDLVLLTNDFERPAQVIGELYKARWQIELFFKWLKQNLKVKTFIGRSENAVRIQIAIAMITYLLVALHRYAMKLPHSMKHCLLIMRASLFQRPELDHYHERRRQKQLSKHLVPQMSLSV